MNKEIITITLITFLLSGCTTFYTQQSLSPVEKIETQNTPFLQIVVGVNIPDKPDINKSNNIDYIAKNLITKLNKTKIFKTVNFTNELNERPDLAIDIIPTDQKFRCMTGEASLMIMSLGIIPMNISGEKEYIFEMRGPENRESIKFHIKEKQTAYMGSLISLLNLSPTWSFQQDENLQIESFAHEILLKKDEITKIITAK